MLLFLDGWVERKKKHPRCWGSGYGGRVHGGEVDLKVSKSCTLGEYYTALYCVLFQSSIHLFIDRY